MAPTLARTPFHRDRWIYEEKVDGWRMLAYKDGDRVRLISRNGVIHTHRSREPASAIEKLRPGTLILDGEVAVVDERLVSRFRLLGEADPPVLCTPTIFIAFDVLQVDDQDARRLPLHRRRTILKEATEGTMRNAAWLEPRLLAEVSYGEIVDGRLRVPMWRGLVRDEDRSSLSRSR